MKSLNVREESCEDNWSQSASHLPSYRCGLLDPFLSISLMRPYQEFVAVGSRPRLAGLGCLQ